MKVKTEPQSIFAEYRSGTEFKAGIGAKGIFEQSKINERFLCGRSLARCEIRQ